MFKKMLRLAFEAVKVEAERWINPTPAGAEHVDTPAPSEPVAVAPARAVVDPSTSKWASSTYHMTALNSPTCLEDDCGAPKKVGMYRCPGCTKIAVAARGVIRAT